MVKRGEWYKRDSRVFQLVKILTDPYEKEDYPAQVVNAKVIRITFGTLTFDKKEYYANLNEPKDDSDKWINVNDLEDKKDVITTLFGA